MILVVDLDIGLFYVVWYVDNLVVVIGDGLFEFCFVIFVEVEVVFGFYNVIFVYDGDGIIIGMDFGIVFKSG